MSSQSSVTIDLSVPNIEWISEDAQFLESHRGLTRYLIAERLLGPL
ncbi:hypothetical protein U5801_26740 [Lamprobacter modestohalophilus]|nr:hypothetical protein [Lamprobacter modestohalophilus]MEA1053374.1 hypothetical protein [Lamprobacter modestohalophilus]